MSLIADLKSLDRSQKSAIWASYLGWTLDAFDFFLMVFMLKAIAAEFGSDIKTVGFAVTLTLAARPFGALLFGFLADRFGQAAFSAPEHTGVNLAHARVDHRENRRAGIRGILRERGKRGNRNDGNIQCQCESLRHRDGETHAGKRTGSAADGNAVELRA